MTIENRDERLHLARALVRHLEAGDDQQAEQVIRKLAGEQAERLYTEVGHLTRELHDTMNSFLEDAQLAEIAHVDIPDASERLRYVITTTEQAAHATLSAVEAGLPLVDDLKEQAVTLLERWRQTPEDGAPLSGRDGELEAFLEQVRTNTTTLHARMSEVLIAQGFQDITGQIIRKVIDLVQNLEVKLVELIRLSGHAPSAGNSRSVEELAGPAVPGVAQGEMITDQDDVDDLLSSLGF